MPITVFVKEGGNTQVYHSNASCAASHPSYKANSFGTPEQIGMVEARDRGLRACKQCCR